MPTAPARQRRASTPHAARLLLAGLALLVACNREPRPGKLALPAAESIVEPALDPSLLVVVSPASLRQEPSEHARVQASAPLLRGDRVTRLEERESWTRVRGPDGQAGWVRAGTLARASDVQEGTVLLPASAFDRPDLLAANVKRKLDPGALLFIRKSKDLFSEVDGGSGASAWILTDQISTRPEDLAAARMVERARAELRAGRLDGARDLLAQLRARWADSPLVPVLALECGEPPPPTPGSETPTDPGSAGSSGSTGSPGTSGNGGRAP